jgi:hypothetical protein
MERGGDATTKGREDQTNRGPGAVLFLLVGFGLAVETVKV